MLLMLKVVIFMRIRTWKNASIAESNLCLERKRAPRLEYSARYSHGRCIDYVASVACCRFSRTNNSLMLVICRTPLFYAQLADHIVDFLESLQGRA